MSKFVNIPRLPPELVTSSNRKLTDEQIELGKELLKDNSERYVANLLGVSRHTMKMHCKPGYREWYYEAHKKKWRQDPDKKRVATRKRLALLREVKPEEMKLYYRQHYQDVRSHAAALREAAK